MSAKQATRGGLRSALSGEKMSLRLEAAKDYFTSLPKKAIFEYTILAMIVLGAAVLRLLPLRWGAYISEFDPYQQYRMASYVLENGFSSWFSWHDDMSWYPWGRDIATSNYPGTSFTAAVTFNFLRTIGFQLSLYQWCVFFPVVFASLTCIAAYLFGREIGGGGVGLFSALFIAFNSSHISRTSLGWFDDETIGIFLILLLFTLFLRASSLGRPVMGNLIYSIMAGLSLAYLASSWGAFRYPAVLLALYTLILVLLRKGNRHLLMSYGVTFGIAFYSMAQIPMLGYIFLKEWTTLAIAAIFVILAASEALKVIRTGSGRYAITLALIVVAIISGYIMLRIGLISSLTDKFAAVLNPSFRTNIPLVESVAEHKTGTWALFFNEFGVLILLGLFGFYFTAKRFQPRDIFLILFCVSSAYFASSFARLTLLMTPSFTILSAVAVEGISKPSLDILKEKIIPHRRSIKAVARVGKEYSLATFMIVIVALMPTFYYAVQSAYTPVTIATSLWPVRPAGEQVTQYQDWLQALVWMRDNLPEDSVVMSWWDYGYWITNIAEKSTLADNGTINASQIATIACTFLSNETWAIPIIKRYNVSHIAIFVTFTRDESGGIRYIGLGEGSKWYWMAKIGNGTKIGDNTFHFYQKMLGEESVFYRTIHSKGILIANDTITRQSIVNEDTILGKMIQEGVSPGTGSEEDYSYFENAYTSKNRFVLLYRVLYLKEAALTCELNPTTITYGGNVTAIGQLSTPEGEPLPGRGVIIESRMENWIEWNEIARTVTDIKGRYMVSWGSNAGNYSIRVRWPGERGLYAPSLSPIQRLTVNRAEAEVSCELSNSTITLGEDVEITVKLSTPSREGNVTVQYRSENEDWKPVKVGLIENGTFLTTWRPPVQGTLQLQAVWTGSFNYKPATSNTVTLEVKAESS